MSAKVILPQDVATLEPSQSGVLYSTWKHGGYGEWVHFELRETWTSALLRRRVHRLHVQKHERGRVVIPAGTVVRRGCDDALDYYGLSPAAPVVPTSAFRGWRILNDPRVKQVYGASQ